MSNDRFSQLSPDKRALLLSELARRREQGCCTDHSHRARLASHRC